MEDPVLQGLKPSLPDCLEGCLVESFPVFKKGGIPEARFPLGLSPGCLCMTPEEPTIQLPGRVLHYVHWLRTTQGDVKCPPPRTFSLGRNLLSPCGRNALLE